MLPCDEKCKLLKFLIGLLTNFNAERLSMPNFIYVKKLTYFLNL